MSLVNTRKGASRSIVILHAMTQATSALALGASKTDGSNPDMSVRNVPGIASMRRPVVWAVVHGSSMADLEEDKLSFFARQVIRKHVGIGLFYVWPSMAVSDG
jgi:hypothetical protein